MILVTGKRFLASLQPTLVANSIEPQIVHDVDGLPNPTMISADEILVGYNTGVIIPESTLRAVSTAYNFHGGPPEFPGRDPHHWAIHRRAKEFGATLHVMGKNVDDGPILDVYRFSIPKWAGPIELREMTEVVTKVMFARYLPGILSAVLQPNGEAWGPIKTTRADALKVRGQLGFETF